MTGSATVTSICNRALGSIGTRSTIQSINDGSNEANQCALFYDPCRQELLRSAYWNCARKQANLTVSKAAPGTPENQTSGTQTWDPSTQPPPPWLYSYLVPSDCLRMRFLMPQINTNLAGTTPLFSVQTGAYPLYANTGFGTVGFALGTDVDTNGNGITIVLTNQSQAIAVYTLDLQATNLFDSQFEAAFVSALAAYLAIPLTGEVQIRAQQSQDAMNRVIAARGSDGNEGTENQNFNASWIIARGAGGGFGLGNTIQLGLTDPSFFAWV